MSPERVSPVQNLLPTESGTTREIKGMQVLLTTPQDEAIMPYLAIADCSCLTRFGVKGSGAAQWLQSQGLTIPDRPNCWCPLPTGGLIARLGLSEFLIEDSLHSDLALQLAQACESPPARVYPVLRQDLAIALHGTQLPQLLLQTCNIDFQSLPLSQNPVILTSMIGVSVIVIPGDRAGIPFYRIWCDGTLGWYFWQTTVAIAQELKGGISGLAPFFPSSFSPDLLHS